MRLFSMIVNLRKLHGSCKKGEKELIGTHKSILSNPKYNNQAFPEPISRKDLRNVGAK